MQLSDKFIAEVVESLGTGAFTVWVGEIAHVFSAEHTKTAAEQAAAAFDMLDLFDPDCPHCAPFMTSCAISHGANGAVCGIRPDSDGTFEIVHRAGFFLS